MSQGAPHTTTPKPAPDITWLLLIGVAIAVGITGFQDLIKPNVFPKRFGEVVPGQIYRSGKLTPAALTKVVREHDIKTIVDFGAWPEGSRADQREAATAEALGVDRVRLPGLSGDSTGEINGYVEALRIMNDPARQPVLVHCGAGTERTGCVVALYRMFEEGWTLEDAYAEADDKGHSPDRNPHLRETLEQYTELIRESLETGVPITLPGDDAK